MYESIITQLLNRSSPSRFPPKGIKPHTMSLQARSISLNNKSEGQFYKCPIDFDLETFHLAMTPARNTLIQR